MGRLSATILTLVAGLAAALALASCGGGDNAELLPGSTASEINSNLDQVELLASEGDCTGAEDAAGEVANQVEALNGVDAKLKRALSQGAGRLNEVVASCQEAEEEEPEEETLEPVEEVETEEKKEKPKKPEKPEKPEREEKATETGEEKEGEGPAPQAKGKDEEEEAATPPPVEPPSQSGGVGPGAPVGEG